MTNAYTFKVEMVIEIFAKDKESAQAQLDEKGGYITERNVELIATTPLPRPDIDEDMPTIY